MGSSSLLPEQPHNSEILTIKKFSSIAAYFSYIVNMWGENMVTLHSGVVQNCVEN